MTYTLNKRKRLKIATRIKRNSLISILPIPISHKNQLAFTLAEILVTLTIIGIIATLTIPVLIQSCNDIILRTEIKEGYSFVEQLAKRLTIDNGGSLANVCPSIDSNCFRDKLLPYINYNKTCPSGTTTSECWHNSGKWFYMDGSDASDGWTNDAQIVLSNKPYLLNIWHIRNTCKDNLSCGLIFIDINGFKKPNTIGKDIFTIRVMENRVMPYGGVEQGFSADDCSITGYSCIVDYLKQ